ncbi:sigma-70 family RNA polymerase sigma factor [Aeromicrobium alkaliterrae]|uniref:Sigma-70 family RNA polymerase sigma factor n=1 Tax=Aeromicrobium alkaliterrae TaxID=302168 RepID=A0ABN2K6G1_9ACTN
MARTFSPASSTDDASDLQQARSGDHGAFSRLVGPLSPELRAHCYRMLGSFDDAEDALQDTLVRAWRAIGRFEGRSSVRTWLYSIATRVCLDGRSARARRALPMDLGPSSAHAVLESAPAVDTAWLGPMPDDPGDQALAREAVDLAFVAALQHLPGNQRAALLLFEVIGLSAAEIADVMDTTTASVNSALARARRALAQALPERDASQADSAEQLALAQEFATALQAADLDRFTALLTDDVTWSMPPLPDWYRGRAAVTDFTRHVPMGSCGEWQWLPVIANGTPAIALYLRPEGAATHTPWSINVLATRGSRISTITSFLEPEAFARFGLPPTLG